MMETVNWPGRGVGPVTDSAEKELKGSSHCKRFAPALLAQISATLLHPALSIEIKFGGKLWSMGGGGGNDRDR